MEDTVDKLEAMFKKAEADVELIHRKLENQCAAQCEGVTLDEDNQVKVLQQISQIKDEYQQIMQETKEIQKAQSDAMLYFRDTLTEACSTLMHLQSQSGLQTEKPEELSRVEELLGIQVPDTPSNQHTDTVHSTHSGTAHTVHTTQNSTEPNTEPASTSNGHSKPHTELSAYEKRERTTRFLTITEEEFQSVSTLIRGRVKLSDVNITYHILWEHFSECDDAEALTPTDMHKMGLRVTGKTGDAKLKVLRSLKLLSISKKGEVKLL